MDAVMEVIRWAIPEVEGDSCLMDDLLSTEALTKALSRVQPGKAVGTDGFDVYLLKRAGGDTVEAWRQIVKGMVADKDFPHEWNQWIAMLAMKPGEEPTNFERRRDLWLIPGSQKLLTLMLTVEYDRASQATVPLSNAGFTADRNAGEQTLAMRLAAEQCMKERRTLYRGYCDYGTFFMSVVHNVQWEVERRCKVSPEVTEVMKALRIWDSRARATRAVGKIRDSGRTDEGGADIEGAGTRRFGQPSAKQAATGSHAASDFKASQGL